MCSINVAASHNKPGDTTPAYAQTREALQAG